MIWKKEKIGSVVCLSILQIIFDYNNNLLDKPNKSNKSGKSNKSNQSKYKTESRCWSAKWIWLKYSHFSWKYSRKWANTQPEAPVKFSNKSKWFILRPIMMSIAKNCYRKFNRNKLSQSSSFTAQLKWHHSFFFTMRHVIGMNHKKKKKNKPETRTK